MSDEDVFGNEASRLQADGGDSAGAVRSRGAREGFFGANDLVDPTTVDDDVDLGRALFAEFIGSFFLTLIVLGAVYGSALVTFDTVSSSRTLLIALAYGFALASCLYAFSFPSADRRQVPNVRHLNPAVTFALVASLKMNVGHAVLYWMAQVCASGLAVLALFFLTPFEKKDILTAYPLGDGVNVVNTWLTESVLAFVLVLVTLMAMFGHLGGRQPSIAQSVRETSPMTAHEVNSIMAGLGAFVCAYAGGPISGGYMNPLMAIGVGILSGSQEVGAYVAPVIGAAGAVVIGLVFGFKTKFLNSKIN